MGKRTILIGREHESGRHSSKFHLGGVRTVLANRNRKTYSRNGGGGKGQTFKCSPQERTTPWRGWKALREKREKPRAKEPGKLKTESKKAGKEGIQKKKEGKENKRDAKKSRRSESARGPETQWNKDRDEPIFRSRENQATFGTGGNGLSKKVGQNTTPLGGARGEEK